MTDLISRSFPRSITFTPNINPYALGSVCVEFGSTKVHVTVSLEKSVPPFLRGKGQGWMTAEYSMLPMATHTRSQRERQKVSGRTQEIQRLIGRSLRSVLDLSKIGERTLTIDCDVLVADGGTRTASVTGAYVALAIGVNKLMALGELKESPLKHAIAAVSIGINQEGKVLADLNYEEDSQCETDMNIVMTDTEEFIEIQGTAEKKPFTHQQMLAMMDCARQALRPIFEAQTKAIQSAL
jgi:ribonuclease PH